MAQFDLDDLPPKIAQMLASLADGESKAPCALAGEDGERVRTHVGGREKKKVMNEDAEESHEADCIQFRPIAVHLLIAGLRS